MKTSKTTVLPENILKRMNKEDRPKGASGLTAMEAVRACDMLSEKELSHHVESYLRLQGIVFCKARTDQKSNMTVGWPDITFAIRGMAVAFELKSKEGKLTEEQVICHRKMKENGWSVYVIREFQEAVAAVRFQTFKGFI